MLKSVVNLAHIDVQNQPINKSKESRLREPCLISSQRVVFTVRYRIEQWEGVCKHHIILRWVRVYHAQV